MRTSFFVAGLAALLGLAACSPQTFTMGVEMRYPSKSGLDLGRKSMSIVYMDDGTDTTFNNTVASSLARSLEKDYFAGDEAIGVYKIPADSVDLDLMHRLVMDTGDDVVFLLGPPTFGAVSFTDNAAVQNAVSVDSAFVCRAQIPYNSRLFVYDSMGKEDKMQMFRSGSVLSTMVYNNGMTPKEHLTEKALAGRTRGAEIIGAQISNRFIPTWKEEGYSIYYFESLSDDWIEALNDAYEYRWKRAADIWMKHVNDNNLSKRSCACYNLALAFYMMGDLNLATKWLDRADSVESLSLSPGLRKRIEARK